MNSAQSRLLDLVPPIRRARDYRLYTAEGRRLVDLWQYDGAALLGHTAPGLLTALKNTASRGLFVPLPHPGALRLERALRRLFPQRDIRVYSGAAAADAALAAAGYGALGCADFPDPGRGEVGADAVASKWRPWCPNAATAIQAPILPLPWQNGPVVLTLDAAVAGRFPPSDQIAPLVLATAARAVDDLAAMPAEHGSGKFRRLGAALARSAWRRRGIYLHLGEDAGADGVTDDAYAALFAAFLRAGFLLPPDPRGLLILPGELSPGEEAQLGRALSIPAGGAIL